MKTSDVPKFMYLGTALSSFTCARKWNHWSWIGCHAL